MSSNQPVEFTLSGVFPENAQKHLLPIRESEAPLSARLAPAYPAMMYRGLLPVKFTTKYVIQLAHLPQEISFRLILAYSWRQFLSNFSRVGLQPIKFSYNMLQKSLEEYKDIWYLSNCLCNNKKYLFWTTVHGERKKKRERERWSIDQGPGTRCLFCPLSLNAIGAVRVQRSHVSCLTFMENLALS